MKTRIWPAIAGALFSLSALAQTGPEVTLTRIECGTGAKPTNVAERFTDTFAYKDLNLTFTFSCYLIKHGDEYMVWDTGFAPGSNPNAPRSEERRVGKSVDLGGRRIIKKKRKK